MHIGAALCRGDRGYGRRTSLAIGVISIYVALSPLVAHEESMDVLITLTGAFLTALSAYVLWCAATDRPVANPLSKG